MGFVSRCTQCGQADDHPKTIVNADRPDESVYHYDCAPVDVRNVDEHHRQAAELALGGTKGDELRASLAVSGNKIGG